MKSKINNNSTSKSPLYKPIFTIKSPNITYDEINHTIISNYQYQTSKINDKLEIHPTNIQLNFRTNTMIPKVGLMIVGIGGNNGTTLVASIEANRQNLTWETKDKTQQANYYGSITQASTVYMGMKDNDEKVYIPFHHLLPMINPNDLIISGWDISALNLKEAMKRAKVLDINLQQQLYSFMEEQTPLPGIYDPSFIAMNQMSRADNIITGNKKEQLDVIRTNIRDFKEKHNLEKVIVLWTANTERYCKVSIGVHDTIKNLLQGITNNESEISPSTLYAVASILEGCSFINGSPQNTLVPGVIELAKKYQVFIAGDDFKTGQTKLKSVLVDYLISAGIKPQAIVSYNHLGNNDGFNLSSYEQFQSKEISKSNVIDDMIKSNNILYSDNEHPDHCVVIKYVPHVGDSKRAIDEYTSEIFMGGKVIYFD